MDYKKLSQRIESVILKNPADPEPYEDLFSVVVQWEKEDYASTTRRRLLKKIFGVNGSPADFDRKIHATT